VQSVRYDATDTRRIDVWLSSQEKFSRSYIKARCQEQKILVNNKAVKASHILKEGDVVTYDLTQPELNLQATDIKIDIIFEDNDLMIINKPAGLTVHPGAGNKTNTLVNALLFHNKQLSDQGQVFRPGIIHRLDKDTSGLMVVAKNNQAHNLIAEEFKQRTVEKKYLALIHGYLKEKEGHIKLPIARHTNNYQKFAVNMLKGKDAHTEYKVVKEFNEKSLVDITLHTGRTHQIRVHFSHLGHALVGDGLYGKKGGERQLLHAYHLSFNHPVSGKKLSFTLSFPKWA